MADIERRKRPINPMAGTIERTLLAPGGFVSLVFPVWRPKQSREMSLVPHERKEEADGGRTPQTLPSPACAKALGNILPYLLTIPLNNVQVVLNIILK